MTDRRWRKWELTGLFLTLIFGNLLHFVYDWIGQNSVVAAFAAVNESTWEHMKLLAMPWVIWSLVEAVALRSSRQSVLMARALGLLAGLVTIPTVYYTYTGALGVSSMIVEPPYWKKPFSLPRTAVPFPSWFTIRPTSIAPTSICTMVPS